MLSRPPRPLKGFTLLCVEVAYELLQKWFNNSCCNFSYLALTSQKLDLDLILEASSLVLEGSQAFFLQWGISFPSLYPFLFFLPILEHEPVTFGAPLYLICTPCLLDCLCFRVDSLPGWEFWLLGRGVSCLLGCEITQPAYYEQHHGTFPQKNSGTSSHSSEEELNNWVSVPRQAKPGGRTTRNFSVLAT